ncbi:hypothetical protein ACM61V_05995 [Sphingomonas sp. TX0543]|uniref:hypothetical protein n=1 Tax=unclassified Sphingomonas TaxID=196159 RepID=UPI001BB1EFCE|nr:hypothetical protein [Sphingomonas sp. 3P27F8]
MYDSAEKIFELSRFQPVGLMIYNNAHHMNAPLEVVVRDFREKQTTGTFDRLVSVWPKFSEFLLNFGHSDEDEFDHLRQLVAAELNQLSTVHVNAMLEALLRGRGRRAVDPVERVRSAIAARQAEAEDDRIDGFLDGHSEADFISRYGAVIDGIINVALSGLEVDASLRSQLHTMIFTLVRSRIRTEVFTGFVFAGFGSADQFPTMHAVEWDGIYFGEFRVIKEQVIDIDRRGATAAVVPFAQTDMVERFIFGIDKSSEERLERIMMSMVGEILDSRPRTFPRTARKALQEAALQRFREGIEGLSEASEQEVVGVIDHLSKKELAEFAYSLVELTSRKRRYSPDPDTVGGPIDVAVLTRNEGFIWVRRKHYFDIELNPSYAKRVK